MQGPMFAAPPCSTWVWIGRRQTGRSRENPLGNMNWKFVKKANQQVSRVVLLLLVGMILHNARAFVEQPGSTIMDEHPRWHLLDCVLGWLWGSVRFWMKSFGAESQKATLLYSNIESGLQDFCKPLPDTPNSVKTATYRVDSTTGEIQVRGTKALKGTQSYPDAFGLFTAAIYYSNVVPKGDGYSLKELAAQENQLSEDPWVDADLDSVIAYLSAMR